MPIEREKIRSMLLEKGFMQKSGKHYYYYLFVNGKKSSVFTSLSHGPGYKEYSDELVSNVAHQMRLTKKELLQFVDCFLTYEKYIELLRQRDHLS